MADKGSIGGGGNLMIAICVSVGLISVIPFISLYKINRDLSSPSSLPALEHEVVHDSSKEITHRPWGMPANYTPEGIVSAIKTMRADINKCPEFHCKGFPGRKDCTSTLPCPLEYGKLLPQIHWSSVIRATEEECSRTKQGSWDFDGNENIDFLVFYLFFFPELLFQGKTPPGTRIGSLVEFGAHNGISASNTRFFENHLKWKALLIEPTSCMEALKKNRPTATLVLGAVCRERKVITLPGSSSWCPNEDRGEKEVNVECYPLSEVFEQYMETGAVIDFMSIDTEGMEMEAIESIDFSTVSIRVIVAEWRSTDGDKRKDYLRQFGYNSIKISKGDELFWRPDLFSAW